MVRPYLDKIDVGGKSLTIVRQYVYAISFPCMRIRETSRKKENKSGNLIFPFNHKPLGFPPDHPALPHRELPSSAWAQLHHLPRFVHPQRIILTTNVVYLLNHPFPSVSFRRDTTLKVYQPGFWIYPRHRCPSREGWEMGSR